MSGFTKATKKKSKLRLALTGPSGSGKTYGALQIAKGLGGKIACIDTENGSASLYEHIVDFDVMELSAPYTPEAYIAAIQAAEKAGYDTLIIDSITHEWSGQGGVLELLDGIAVKLKGNTWAAWNEMTPRHRKFIDAMLQAKMHIIATGRSKTETAQSSGDNGKKKVVKLGMKVEQREGLEFEFTVVLDIIHDGHYATASKDRTELFGEVQKISEGTGIMLSDWLNSGAEPLVTYADVKFAKDSAIDAVGASKVDSEVVVLVGRPLKTMADFDSLPNADRIRLRDGLISLAESVPPVEEKAA